MAYKDEYEVARLYTDPTFKAKLGMAFGSFSKIRIQLAPPVLSRTDPATGRPKKYSFGPWVFRVFGLLARMKGLRGTRLDPFGRTEERKAERALISEYESVIDGILTALTPDRMKSALALARLPESIRGYGPIKMANIEEARLRRIALLAAFEKVAEAEGAREMPMIAAE
jgi:indolepyruvate ferredoxin oxidoreductase